MKQYYKPEIIKYDQPIRQGFPYNVQIWTFRDDLKCYVYCGNGKFCRTEKEAQEYAAHFLEKNVEG